NGYIHLKSIPGASDELMHEAGLYADRLSVNIEMPTEKGLKLLAPDKDRKDMIQPMNYLKDAIILHQDEKKLLKTSPIFVPAGQTTQMIIGATQETDKEIMYAADGFYKDFNLKRVYYSGYVPISDDKRLPGLDTGVPMVRENRLYQTDWLMRFYGFKIQELLNNFNPHLDLDIDPKLSWALRNLALFPLDINKADLQLILRVPGIGVQSAQKIVAARKFHKLNWDHLKKIGIALNKAKYFIVCNSREIFQKDFSATKIKQFILSASSSKYIKQNTEQLALF
ncbi:MAG: hypothetical protein JWQ25_1712, partial [Daejeonella sp.]|nr:hypothetical protein [Daejeonella sp.]